MKLLVEKFMFSHGGKLYKSGDVFEVDDVTGRELLKRAKGEIELADGLQGTDSTPENNFEGLPEVDLNAAIRKKK